jgi:hypothetical protein
MYGRSIQGEANKIRDRIEVKKNMYECMYLSPYSSPSTSTRNPARALSDGWGIYRPCTQTYKAYAPHTKINIIKWILCKTTQSIRGVCSIRKAHIGKASETMYGDTERMEPASWKHQDDDEGGFDIWPLNEAAKHVEHLVAWAALNRRWRYMVHLYLPNGGAVICPKKAEQFYRMMLGC